VGGGLGAVRLRFALPAEPEPRLARQIKAADRAAAFFEATRLAGFAEDEAGRFFGRPRSLAAFVDASDYLGPWPTPAAERRFLERFAALESAAGAAATATPAAPGAAGGRR
jgi:hypothetical protein